MPIAVASKLSSQFYLVILFDCSPSSLSFFSSILYLHVAYAAAAGVSLGCSVYSCVFYFGIMSIHIQLAELPAANVPITDWYVCALCASLDPI